MTPGKPSSGVGLIATIVGVGAGHARAQFADGFTPPDVSAPLFQVWAFESPAMPAAVLVVMGVATAWTLRRNGKARAGVITAVALLLLAAGLVVSSILVTTEREHVSEVSERFIHAVGEPDLDEASLVMRSTVSLRMGYGASAESRESLLGQIERLHQEVTVRSVRVLDVRPEIRSPTLARVYVRVRVEGGSGLGTIPPYSWWELNLARRSEPGSTWKLAAIEPLWIVGIENPAGR